MVHLAVGEALDRLQGIVSGLRVVPGFPPGATVRLPAEDDAEPESAKGAAAPPLALFLHYVNAKAEISHRRVTVRQVIGRPPATILCFCHERRAVRNFRLDRIQEAACAETGEIYDRLTLLQLLGDRGLRGVDPRVRRAVHVLVFMMRCDGHAHPAELVAVDDALARYMVRFGGDDADHEQAMRMARQVAPDGDDFLIALRSFVKDAEAPQLARWLDRSLGELIDADGTQSADEFAWMTEACDLIARMAEQAR
jgi:uncharacterized tellurite resistance protein B-like protein